MLVPTQDDEFTNRARRIQIFADEARRVMFNLCIDGQISTHGVNGFCHELFLTMVRSDDDHSSSDLRYLFSNPKFFAGLMDSYRSAII